MRTYNNNIELILKNTKPVLEKWLMKWEIPYDELILGKPYPGPDGIYVDDKAVRPRELLEMSGNEIKSIIERDRLK
jgi:capsule biosynthesis phosphatase